ncbi:hypothetical protein [Lentzea atacamensis]|uniref:hypothetical protein n=1 Tax=Lentzea atacamensis TaxID=531938 RepID=UPI001475CD57|nr:hypothetical protein [Lentzea atacamensis]
MFRTLYRTVFGPDRTRVLTRTLDRFRVPAFAALITYGLIWAIIGSVQYVDSPGATEQGDGWWVLIFFATLGPYVLLIWSPLYAWRLAAAGFYFVSGLVDWTGVAPFQYWTAAPLLVAVAAFYSRGIVITVTAISVLLHQLSEYQNHTIGFYIPVIAGAVYMFGARGRAEQELEEERAAKAAL